jgi:hypothetical protein
MRRYILALAAVLAVVHCKAGSAIEGDARAEQYCDAFCSCEGCTEADRGVCVSDMGDLISDAQTSHCDDQLDSYFSCLGKDAFCDSGTYDTSTCRTEENVLSACISGTSGAGGASASSSGTGVGGGGGSCASVNDGTCDEPEGTALCAEGTDVTDCGGACSTCSSLITGASPASVCTASQTIVSDLLLCGCSPCQTQCPGFCAGQADTSTCFTCLQTVCAAQYSTCQGDI